MVGGGGCESMGEVTPAPTIKPHHRSYHLVFAFFLDFKNFILFFKIVPSKNDFDFNFGFLEIISTFAYNFLFLEKKINFSRDNDFNLVT